MVFTKHRLIAALLVSNGQVVQTRRFTTTNMVGSALTAVDFFNTWTVDEICILEISDSPNHLDRFVAIIDELSRRCFVPLSVGGKIRDLGLVERYLKAGADKVVVNTGALDDPGLVHAIAGRYGSQCAVVSIDAKSNPAMPSGYEAMASRAGRSTGQDALDWAKACVTEGAGELLVNSFEHDGDKRGYDLGLISKVAEAVSVPVIAFGGVGNWQHLVDGITLGRADAVAAGNIFHYTEHSTKKAKEFLAASGLPVRDSSFYRVNLPRRPTYRPF